MIKKFRVNFKGFETEIEAFRRLGQRVLPNTWRAFQSIGRILIARIKEVSEAKGVGRRTGAYLRSFQEGYSYPHNGDMLHLHIESAGEAAEYAAGIEFGTKEVDMLKYLSTSTKTRTIKFGPRAGRPYLIIPFQHGAPGAVSMPPMTREVHSVVSSKGFLRSRVTGSKVEQNWKGHSIKRATYQWGSRFTEKMIKGAETPRHLRGMVKMGTPKNTNYMTFRVMSEASRERDPSSWRIPARPGKFVMESAVNQLAPFMEQHILEAFEKDVLGLEAI